MKKETVKKCVALGAKILTVILYGFTLLSAYGGYINPERMTLPAIAVLLFPYFAIATLIVSVIWLIIKKFPTGCIGIAVLLACGPTFPEALPFRFPATASDPGKTFKMVTFNCLHLTDARKKNKKSSRSVSYLLKSGADFICLQELMYYDAKYLKPTTPAQMDSLLSAYPYHSANTRKEIKFLSKYPYKQIDYKLGNAGYYSNFGVYRVYIDNDSLTVINVHLPSFALTDNERNIIKDAAIYKTTKSSIKKFEGPMMRKMRKAFRERAKVAKALAELASKIEGPMIICGDFNDVPGSWTYRQFINAGLNDAYAETGFGHLITYNMHLMFFHIDQILYKGGLMPLYVKKGKVNSSDHYPLEAEFEFL